MNTKPIPFELWKNVNPDLVESAESCDSCHGIGSEMCQFCKGDGYTTTEGDEAAPRYVVTAKAKDFSNATVAKAKRLRSSSFTRRSTNESCHYYFKLKNRRLMHHEQAPIHNR